MKPFSQSSEENKDPILAVLREVFATHHRVLEIGSGTGQHAVYFARHLPHLFWQPSELAENLSGVAAWLDDAGLTNAATPLLLNVEQAWPDISADAVFSANTAHIMAWPQVEAMFAGVGALLPAEGVFALYGPFNYDGRYTSDSNARFDQWLKTRDPLSGVRDFEAVDALARAVGMTLAHDYTMPANNRTLVWHKNG